MARRGTELNKDRFTHSREKFIRILTLLYAIFILVFPYLSPPTPQELSLPWDKLWHYSVYFLLAILLYLSFPPEDRRILNLNTIYPGILWAILDESIQGIFPSRKMDIRDFLSDIGGLTTGFLIIYLIRHIIVRR